VTFQDLDRDVFEMSHTVQPVMLLASNCYKLCFVSFIYTQNTVHYQQVFSLFYRNFRAIFTKTGSNLKKTPLLYSPIHPCTMYWLSNHNLQ